MRTTIRIDDALLRQAREFAARTGRTLTSVIEDALRQALAQRSHSGNRRGVELTTFRGRGTVPGVELDDSAALLDLMDVHAPS